jgi:hypothetical protein
MLGHGLRGDSDQPLDYFRNKDAGATTLRAERNLRIRVAFAMIRPIRGRMWDYPRMDANLRE